jgi:hypothetical protein
MGNEVKLEKVEDKVEKTAGKEENGEAIEQGHMKFTLGERITLLGVLPKEANFVTLKIIRSLEGRLSFTEKELKDFDIKFNARGSSYSWNKEGAEYEAEVEFGEKATDIVVEQLKELDKTEKLTGQHFTVYEKFIK